MSKLTKVATLGTAAISALMPVAAVFATEPTNPRDVQVDQLIINVDETCTFGHAYGESATEIVDGVDHTDGTGYVDVSTGNGDWDANAMAATTSTSARTSETDGVDTLTATMAVNTVNENLGTTKLSVVCTNADGYDIKMTGEALTSTSTGSHTNTIPALGSSAASLSATSSAWAFKFDVTGMSKASSYNTTNWYGAPSSATDIAFKATPSTVTFAETTGNATSSDTITVTYGAGIQEDQPSGSYSGNVTYTLVAPHGVSYTPGV